MSKTRLKIAIIPARGGSKRIPRKNIRPFCGVPAIERTVISLKQSDLFSKVVISTDDLEIARVGLDAGATDIISRNLKLSDDFTPTVPVIADAITQLKLNDVSDVDICCVYPVNPFLDIGNLVEGLALLNSNQFISYVNPIVTYQYPVERSLRIEDKNRISMVDPMNLLKRTQDFEDYYHDAGQWYWARAKTWLRGDQLLSNSIGLKVPRWLAQDIDTLEDWDYAEILFKLQLMKENFNV